MQRFSDSMDEVVRAIATSAGSMVDCAVVATGGYGRRELGPYSSSICGSSRSRAVSARCAICRGRTLSFVGISSSRSAMQCGGRVSTGGDWARTGRFGASDGAARHPAGARQCRDFSGILRRCAPPIRKLQPVRQAALRRGGRKAPAFSRYGVFARAQPQKWSRRLSRFARRSVGRQSTFPWGARFFGFTRDRSIDAASGAAARRSARFFLRVRIATQLHSKRKLNRLTFETQEAIAEVLLGEVKVVALRVAGGEVRPGGGSCRGADATIFRTRQKCSTRNRAPRRALYRRQGAKAAAAPRGRRQLHLVEWQADDARR